MTTIIIPYVRKKEIFTFQFHFLTNPSNQSLSLKVRRRKKIFLGPEKKMDSKQKHNFLIIVIHGPGAEGGGGAGGGGGGVILPSRINHSLR